MRRTTAYISFDFVPAPKGASTHIEAFARALANHFGSVDLVTVTDRSEMPEAIERWPDVFHYQLPSLGASLIDRVLCFRKWLNWWLASRSYDVIHFRSIFEGTPLLRLNRRPRLIFEVNGLPSIELKYRYPAAADDRDLMAKIVAQENACLHTADRIVTPSAVTRSYLISARKIEAAKISVIPNGVDLDLFRPANETPEPRLIYFGTLSPWQGVETAIRVLEKVRAAADLALTVAGPGDVAQLNSLTSLATKLGVDQRVAFLGPLRQADLAGLVSRSFAVLAPLEMNDRNVVQGCCPLKILEGMASGVPVVASDLPVVRELGEDSRHFLLVKPGSTDQMAQAVLRLFAEPALRGAIAGSARAHAQANFSWQRAGDLLAEVHRELQ